MIWLLESFLEKTINDTEPGHLMPDVVIVSKNCLLKLHFIRYLGPTTYKPVFIFLNISLQLF